MAKTSGVGRRFVQRKQRRDSDQENTDLYAADRPARAAPPAGIVSTEVGDPHACVASMKSESGL